MDRFSIDKFLVTNDPRYPSYQSSSDFTTNASSYYQDLARKQELIELLARRVWEYDELLAAKLVEISDTLQKYSDLLDGKIEDFDRIIIEKTEKWLAENMEGIMSKAVKMVWFGLTDDGYFMAVIPDSWSEVQFDTDNEGRLILTV